MARQSARGTIPAQRAEDTDRWETAAPTAESVPLRRDRGLCDATFTLPMDLLGFLAPLCWSLAHWKGIVVAAGLAVALFAGGGLYQTRRHISFLDVLPSLVGRLLVASSVVGIFVAERHESVDDLGGFLRQAAVSSVGALCGRFLSYQAISNARRRRWIGQSAVIVGRGTVALELAQLLHQYPQYGLSFAGFADVRSDSPERPEDPPLVGYLDELEEMIAPAGWDTLIFADVDCSEARLLDVARSPAMRRCAMWMVPRLRQGYAPGAIPDHIGAIPVVRVRWPGMSGTQWQIKRRFDIAFAALALVLCGPLLLLATLATRIEGGPGVFFRQQRVGYSGRTFQLVKFRSLRPDNEADAQTRWSIADDPRIGPVGRFLRRTSIDEIPQLWNILRGDMTVVGPRPERPHFVDRFSADYPDYAMRHRVPVGLTGLAQVSGLRGETSISDRVRYDNYYIENWSLWLDVKVLLRTIAEVLCGRGR